MVKLQPQPFWSTKRKNFVLEYIIKIIIKYIASKTVEQLFQVVSNQLPAPGLW